MKKIMISVAPVAATDVLINPRAIARDVYECYKNGAAMVHLHCRDLNGRLTPDLSLLEETVAYIRELCDIVVEISTGGVSNLTIEERCQPCYPKWVEANSLNVGSVNLGTAVYQNPIKDVEYCVQKILENKKVPEIEVFELGMINTVRELDDKFHFVSPILFALVFGHGGEMPSTVPALRHMIDALAENFPGRDDILWGYTQAHREDWEMVKVALDMGASTVRIGFEDSDCMAPGVHVDNNAVLIAEVADIVKSKGMLPMTPAEARAMLGIPQLAERGAEGLVIQGVSYLSDFEAKKAIIEAARRLEAKGFLTAGDGSISVRVGPNAVWVTVDGADKAALTQDMLVRVDLNGKGVLSNRPKPLGEDLPIHLNIYRENENVQCVLHAYPPCAAVLSQQGQGLPAADFSPSVRKLGRMELIAGLTGEALAKTVAAQSRTGRGVLLENDGCMFWAKAPMDTCHLAEAMEYRWTVGNLTTPTSWSGCVGCQGCGGCTGGSQCDKCSGCDGTRPAPPEPPRRLEGVTPLIQPGQPLPPLPRQEETAPPAASMPPAVPAGPKADAMAEVVRRVLQGLT